MGILLSTPKSVIPEEIEDCVVSLSDYCRDERDIRILCRAIEAGSLNLIRIYSDSLDFEYLANQMYTQGFKLCDYQSGSGHLFYRVNIKYENKEEEESDDEDSDDENSNEEQSVQTNNA